MRTSGNVAAYSKSVVRDSEKGFAFDWLSRRLAENVKHVPGPLPTPCWVWTGPPNGNGYGRLNLPRKGGKQRYALVHVVVYRQYRGVIRKKHVVDHLCSVRLCFNPGHLEAVTGTVNTMRGKGPTAMNARKTHCVRGHALPERNARGKRECQMCRKEKRYPTNQGQLPGILSDDAVLAVTA